MVNLNLEWEHKDENKTHYLNIPIKLVKSIDEGYGYHGKLICNKCCSDVEQYYICSSCGDKAKIGEIIRRQDTTTELVYEEQQRQEFMKNEVDKTIKVTNEIDIDINLLSKIERFEKPFEIYTNIDKINPVILKIYNYLKRENKTLICTFGYSNRGKSDDLGGIIIAGDGKLLLIQLRDYRLIRKPKQENLPQVEHNNVTDILDNVSENHYPEKYEKFLEAIEKGEKIEVTAKPEKTKIEVECSFLD